MHSTAQKFSEANNSLVTEYFSPVPKITAEVFKLQEINLSSLSNLKKTQLAAFTL
jgi:hypothetical protein